MMYIIGESCLCVHVCVCESAWVTHTEGMSSIWVADVGRCPPGAL